MKDARQLVGFALVGLIWGSAWLFVRAVDIPPLRTLATRYAVGAAILAIVCLIRRSSFPRWRVVVMLMLTGVTMMALPAILTVWASGRISPGFSIVLLSMTPLLAALLEGRASGGLLVALVGGIAGTTLIASQGLSFALAQWAGAAEVAGAALLFAGSVVYLKKKYGEGEFCLIGVDMVAAIQLATGSIVVACVSEWTEGADLSVWIGRPKDIVLVIVWAIVGSALVYPLYHWLLRSNDSFQVLGTQWLLTVAGLVESFLLVRQTPSGRILAGLALLLVSFAALLRARQNDDALLTIEATPRTSSN